MLKLRARRARFVVRHARRHHSSCYVRCHRINPGATEATNRKSIALIQKMKSCAAIRKSIVLMQKMNFCAKILESIALMQKATSRAATRAQQRKTRRPRTDVIIVISVLDLSTYPLNIYLYCYRFFCFRANQNPHLKSAA